MGYLLACAGEYERGSALLRKAIARNPRHPGWFHQGLHTVHYARREYEQAYMEATQTGSQVLFWNPVLRAAALGKLGRRAEAVETGEVRASLGAGLSLFCDLVRFDAARGLRDGRWEWMLSVSPAFRAPL